MIRTVIPVTNYWENTRDNFNINKIGLKGMDNISVTFILANLSYWTEYRIQ